MTFYFVAREGSYSTASEKLFITQSAVTQQIKALETQFGVKLFRIMKQKAYLTPVGERLFAYADEFIHHVSMMETFLKTYRLTILHVGISSALMFYMMPVIDRFKEIHPTVQVSVRESVSEDLIRELMNFRHDICFVGQPFPDEATYPTGRVTGYRIPVVEKMVFVTGPEYPIDASVESEWTELACLPLIIQSEGSNARRLALEHFAKRGLKPIIGTEVDNVEYAREFARQGQGIALMFWPNVRADVLAGKLKIIPVVGGDIRLGIDILLNPEIALSPLAQDFITLLKGHFGEFNPLKAATPPPQEATY